MISSVNGATPQPQAAVQPQQTRRPAQTSAPKAAVQPAQTPQPAQASAPKAAITDTVQISNAAKILQEATETPGQTAKEAASGDLQAKALLARETADRGGTK
jgi:hypothetical protein